MEPRAKTSRARVWQKEWESMPWDNMRRTAFTETVDPTYQAQSERIQNKRCKKMERYKDYQVFYYGSEREKAVRKSHLREELKANLDQIEKPHHVFAKSFEESKMLAEADKQIEHQEKEAKVEKRKFLSTFRDENKTLIEEHAAQRKAEREAERNADKQRIEECNPINWSHTLW